MSSTLPGSCNAPAAMIRSYSSTVIRWSAGDASGGGDVTVGGVCAIVDMGLAPSKVGSRWAPGGGSSLDGMELTELVERAIHLLYGHQLLDLTEPLFSNEEIGRLRLGVFNADGLALGLGEGLPLLGG